MSFAMFSGLKLTALHKTNRRSAFSRAASVRVWYVYDCIDLVPAALPFPFFCFLWGGSVCWETCWPDEREHNAEKHKMRQNETILLFIIYSSRGPNNPCYVLLYGILFHWLLIILVYFLDTRYFIYYTEYTIPAILCVKEKYTKWTKNISFRMYFEVWIEGSETKNAQLASILFTFSLRSTYFPYIYS